MQIGKYKLEFKPKVERAIAKVGKDNENAILAEYDKLGGLITLNGEKVKRGSFYNVESGKAHTKPKVVVIKKARASMEETIEEEEEVVEEKPKEKKAEK